MHEETERSQRDETMTAGENSESPERTLPRWKMFSIGTGALLLVSGLALQGYGWVSGSDGTPTGAKVSTPNGSSNLTGQKFLPNEESDPPDAPRAEERSALDDWSPTLVKGGFGLLVGFCVGYALRTFAKLAALFFGLVFLAILLLSWGGLVTVHWDKMSDGFDHLVGAMKGQFQSFKAFLQGSLPTAGLSGLGLFTGLKRK